MTKTPCVVAAAIIAIALGAGITPANAAPNPNSSCAAQLGALGELGNPGDYQRVYHDPTFGLRAVRSVATLEDCTY